jgi:hypothetical protein
MNITVQILTGKKDGFQVKNGSEKVNKITIE